MRVIRASVIVVATVAAAVIGATTPAWAGTSSSTDSASVVHQTGGSSSSAGVTAVGSRLINGDGDTAGKCLEIPDGGTSRTYVIMNSCHTNAHQSWYFTSHTGGYVAIRSHDADAAGTCLTAIGSNGYAVRMASCPTVGASQAWVILQHANGWFQLRNKAYSDQCLDVRDNGLSNIVQTWLCGPSNKGNQLWHWHSVG
jgi:hypothetical protein